MLDRTGVTQGDGAEAIREIGSRESASLLPRAPALKFAPSLLAADFGHIADQVAEVERAGAHKIHLDVMDGLFVPNISFGIPIIKAVNRLTDLPLQTHLMIEKPERYIEAFREAGSDIIIVHEESSVHLHRTLQAIRASGAMAGVALNPHTPIDVLQWVLDELDCLLIMTVNPGFGGQTFLDSILPKVTAARAMLGDEVDIVVDGGVDEETAPRIVAAGCNVLVAGTSVFGHPDGATAGLDALRRAVM